MTMTEKHHKSMLLAGAAVIALGASPVLASAYAQDEADDDVITITGIKRSIQDSLATKRENTSIVEAVSAEDIGKLPDLSIADSLARLPGLTAQRVRGRAQQLSIRGLGPDFSISLLNGREQVSAGDNRGIEFDQYPAELISQGVVYKTPDARLAATGIAGAVDLKTVRPLDVNGRQVTVSGRYVWNDNGSLNPDFDDTGYRAFGSYIDQNEDGTFGWSLAVTTQSNPSQNFQRELKTASGQVGTTGTGQFYAADNPRSGSQSREFERTSVSGSLQWEPHENRSVTVDAFYSDFEDRGIFRGIEHPLASWSGATLDSTTGSGPFVDSATYTDANAIFRTDIEGRAAELFSGGINWQEQWTDRLSTTVDVSISQIDRTDIDAESYAGFGNAGSGRDTITFITPANGEYRIQPTRAYNDPSTLLLTDPGGWGQVGFIKEPEIEDEIQQIRLEAEYVVDNTFIESVVGGLLFTERDKSRVSIENFLDFAPGVATNNELALVDTGTVIGTADLSHLGLEMVAYDPQALLDDGIYQLRAAQFNSVLAKAWEVNEEINTFYAMANINSMIGEMPLRGNVGFQYQQVDQSSTGISAINGPTNPLVSDGDDYTHFLPSVNLSLEVQEDTFVRFAYAQTVTRPRMDAMRASQEVSLDSNVCINNDPDGPIFPTTTAYDPDNLVVCLGASGGNPVLKPFESDSFDLAFERYFLDGTAAIAIAAYYKDLSEYVFEGFTIPFDFTDVATDTYGAAYVAAEPRIVDGKLTRPTNTQGGSISGYEIALTLPFDEFLPPELEGFGAQFSYSYTDSDVSVIDAAGDTQTITIPGLSEDVWNGSIYYENHGWRGRLSARHRSDYLAELPNFDGELNLAQGIEETIVDAQIGYEFQDGPIEGLSVIFEAYNLTDEPFGTLENPGPGVSFPSRLEFYGTSYNINISKTF